MSIKSISNDNIFIIWSVSLIPLSLIVSPAINTILIVLLFFGTFFHLKKEKTRVKLLIILKNKSLLVIFSFYVLYLLLIPLGLLYSINIEEGLSLLRKRFPLYVLPIILMSSSEKVYRKSLFLFVCSVLLSCLYTNIHVFMSIISQGENFKLFFTKYLRFTYQEYMFYGIHPPYFGMFINISLVLVYFFKNQNLIKKLYYPIIIFLIINLYLVSSQMSLIAFFVLCTFLVFGKMKRLIGIKYTYLIFLILFSLFAYFLINGKKITNDLIQDLEIENSSHFLKRINHFYNKGDLTRLRNWESGIKTINEFFFFGAGTGDAIDEMLKYRHKKSWIYTEKANSHNQYIEELARFGIVGGLFFIGSIIFLMVYLYKKKQLMFFTIMMVISLAMITESMINRHLGIVAFGFFGSISFFNLINKSEVN